MSESYAIERAAEWFIALDVASTGDRVALAALWLRVQEWISESPGNREAYDLVERAWRIAGCVRASAVQETCISC